MSQIGPRMGCPTHPDHYAYPSSTDARSCSACDGIPCCETSDPANRPEHDDQCEAEFIEGDYAWTECYCASRAVA